MTETLYGIQHYVAEATAYAQGTEEDITAFGGTGKSAKEYAESIDPESLKVKTVFSINEARKDASGNPNFMSISGNQITFNGAVKYTQANGESKEYASVSPIALTSGYVMLNNGVASVVPALGVQQSEPTSPTNQTVWFNPYNNQAKQYNGTDWVDYNGVPVGTITDGVAYNYQYNTQKNVEPFALVITEDTKKLTNINISPDRKAKVSVDIFGAGKTYTAESSGWLYIWMRDNGNFGYMGYKIDESAYTIGVGGSSTVTSQIEHFLEKGSVLSCTSWDSSGSYSASFCPIKGEF